MKTGTAPPGHGCAPTPAGDPGVATTAVRRPRTWSGWLLVALVGLSACSGPSAGSSSGSAPGSASSRASAQGSAAAAGTDRAGMPAPVYDEVADFLGVPQVSNRLRIRVYPLQRVAGAVLLTVDFTPLDPHGSVGTTFFDFIGSGSRAGALKGASLVDTDRVVRYGPLRLHSVTGAAYSSAISQIVQKSGVTYRIGAFFPDPGADVQRLGVDLQEAGFVPGVPVVSGTPPAPGLVAGLAGAPAAAPGDMLVTWPVTAPSSDAYVDRHDLVAAVVGGTVNEGGGTAQGQVTVNADVLFAFDSATVTARGLALVRQAAAVLAAKADPAEPVAVVGHTDSKGTAAYNQKLSLRRAEAVSAALSASGTAGGLTLRPQGRGQDQPVAPNRTPGGADDPEGRALNRRVEILYSPRPSPTTAPSPAQTPDPSPSAASPSTVSPSTAQPPSATASDAVDLPGVLLPIGPGGAQVGYSARLRPVLRVGRMALVRFDLTLAESADQSADLLNALSTHYRFSRDLGAVHLVDQATRRVYVPAYDHDDVNRVLCTYTSRMSGGQPYHFACLTAAVPAEVRTVTVSLGPLGTASGVPVTG